MGCLVRSEVVAGGQHKVARLAIRRRIVETDVGVIGLVEDIVGIQRRRKVFAELVTSHGVHQPEEPADAGSSLLYPLDVLLVENSLSHRAAVVLAAKPRRMFVGRFTDAHDPA